ncbi:MAG: C25 family cysteine peptidase, partial [Ignavibacteria bacterium]
MIKLTLKYICLFIIFISVDVIPQALHKITVEGSSYDIHVETPVQKFKEQKLNSFTIRDYYEFTDPSNESTYKLPFINIFLAIPPNSKITLTDLEFESKINEKTIPVLNPRAVYKDSVIDYIEKDFFESPKMLKKEPLIQIESYFWFREFYIVQIKVNNFQFNVEQSAIEEISNINFRANISPRHNILSHSPIKIKTDYDRAVKNLISNSDMAEQFRSNATYSLPDTSGTWINYNATYIKIGVDRDAVFRITKSSLENLGVNTNIIDPKTFKMFESGKQIKLLVEGENDGVFNDTDFIEFWGHKNYPSTLHRIINDETTEYNEYLNRYTDTSFYFLTWDGDAGERSDTLGLNLTGISDTLDYHSQLLHSETQSYIQNNDNNEVANQTSNWNKNKTWYWDFLFSQRTFNFNLTDIYPEQNASVFAKLVSFASNYPTNSHQVKLSLNNVLIDSNSINRFEQLLLSGNINSSSLITGSNQILLENIANGSSVNSITIDWFEIEYPRNLQLFNDSLYFTVPSDVNGGLRILKVGNANSQVYRIYKIQPGFKIIDNYSVSGSILFFADTISAGDKYYIESSANINEPKFIYVKNFANLRNYSEQTDYIAITHPAFLVASKNYTQSIASLYNLSTSVFKVDDIFDEFSYGYPYPEGIRLFLNVIYNNLPMQKPVYLTLLGDANYDYKYFKSAYAGLNYVPSFG